LKFENISFEKKFEKLDFKKCYKQYTEVITVEKDIVRNTAAEKAVKS
jgi:hypothetical protein